MTKRLLCVSALLVAAAGCARPSHSVSPIASSDQSPQTKAPAYLAAPVAVEEASPDTLVQDLELDGWVRSSQVLEAMRRVPRVLFVPTRLPLLAYTEHAFDLGHQQVEPPPALVGRVVEALQLTGRERVLAVGTGSGYLAAVLAQLAREVHSTEGVPDLARAARARLVALGAGNVFVHVADAQVGWPAAAPYDRIVLAEAPAESPPRMLDQLARDGVMVTPIGEHPSVQRLTRFRKGIETVFIEDLGERMAVSLPEPK